MLKIEQYRMVRPDALRLRRQLHIIAVVYPQNRVRVCDAHIALSVELNCFEIIKNVRRIVSAAALNGTWEHILQRPVPVPAADKSLRAFAPRDVFFHWGFQQYLFYCANPPPNPLAKPRLYRRFTAQAAYCAFRAIPLAGTRSPGKISINIPL